MRFNFGHLLNWPNAWFKETAKDMIEMLPGLATNQRPKKIMFKVAIFKDRDRDHDLIIFGGTTFKKF